MQLFFSYVWLILTLLFAIFQYWVFFWRLFPSIESIIISSDAEVAVDAVGDVFLKVIIYFSIWIIMYFSVLINFIVLLKVRRRTNPKGTDG